MNPKAFGLVAALAAVILAPAAVWAAKKETPAAAAAALSEAARKVGMAEAPAVVQAAGVTCQVTDARFVGKQEDKKAKTATSFYEVACSHGMGFVVQQPLGGQASAFSCIEANTVPEGATKPALPCILPANANPKAVLTPMMKAGGVTCTPTQARGIGQTKTSTYVEVACQEGPGYIVTTSAPFDPAKGAQPQSCLLFDEADSNIKCIIGDKASRLAVVDRFAQAGSAGCAVKDRRFIGMTKDGYTYFEASCQDGKGFMYKADASGRLNQTIECAKATGLLGGCQLTDARQAASEQAGLYTKLAKAAGDNCAVDKYALFPMRGSDEVVELLCKDGGSKLGIFSATGKGQVLDCGHALVAGYKCGLGKIDYTGLTADLRKFDQKSCVVSDSRLVGKTPKGTMLIEVACADGYKGYVIEYQTAPAVSAVAATGCAFTGGCKLKGNT